jgi:hypothetical protein
MATAGLTWRAIPTHAQSIRALSTLSTSHTYQLKASEASSSRPVIRMKQNNALSRPSILQNPSLHRAFHATTRRSKEHHFDTLKFVQRLREEGFSETQAVAMMRVLSDVIEERFVPASSLKNTLLIPSQHPESNPHHGPPRRPGQGNLRAKGRFRQAAV